MLAWYPSRRTYKQHIPGSDAAATGICRRLRSETCWRQHFTQEHQAWALLVGTWHVWRQDLLPFSFLGRIEPTRLFYGLSSADAKIIKGENGISTYLLDVTFGFISPSISEHTWSKTSSLLSFLFVYKIKPRYSIESNDTSYSPSISKRVQNLG